jgi:hypothetical protein
MVSTNADGGTIYNTAIDKVADHILDTDPAPTPGEFRHDPAILFDTLPEHATPATPTDQQAAYNVLRTDFSSCNLPYSQPLDVSRTYLRKLGTDRFETMRHFRRTITEFVLDPTNEPAGFQNFLWRLPVRLDTAIEYLCISPEEYTTLFENPIPSANGPSLSIFYGYPAGNLAGTTWIDDVLQLPEFLKRTCLTWCDFVALSKCGFVQFGVTENSEAAANLPIQLSDCEPCCLDKYTLQFSNPRTPNRRSMSSSCSSVCGAS